MIWSNNIVSISITKQNVLIAWIKKDKLIACDKFPSYSCDPKLLNIPYLYKKINSFLGVYKLKNSFIVLSTDNIIEQISSDTIESQGFLWKHCEIENQKIYSCGIKDDFLLQLKLLAMKLKINLIRITSEFDAKSEAKKNKIKNPSTKLTDNELFIILGLHLLGKKDYERY